MTDTKTTPGASLPGRSRTRNSRFGKIIIRPLAREQLDPTAVQQALSRHVSGDWGDVDTDNRKVNDLSLKKGYSLHSVYRTGEKEFWIITEEDRSLTTVLMREEGYP